MSQDTVASDVVAICLSREELCSRGIATQEFSGQSARRLILETLESRGEEPWEDMEVEIFTCDDALLVLARPAWNEHHCFCFPSSTELLSAVESTEQCLPASLTYYKGEYVLCIRASADAIPSALYEFGIHEDRSRDYVSHLSEHGKSIIRCDAIGVLREYFLS